MFDEVKAAQAAASAADNEAPTIFDKIISKEVRYEKMNLYRVNRFMESCLS